MKTITIEVVKTNNCYLKDAEIIEKCKDYLSTIELYSGDIISPLNKLNVYVKHIIIDEIESDSKLDFSNLDVKWFIYTLDLMGNQVDYLTDDMGNEPLPICTHWLLPSADFHGEWENLIYDIKIKENLLKYVKTMMFFSDSGVNSNIICANRVVLLHGPPGTGKTSLCKALAHKLSIRLKNKFRAGQLIEINSHSLFSKWFSESGKLVTKMFTKILELVENPRMFVCVLIDEIESLTRARTQAMSGNEPSDAIRVVNAVLTQIDRIKRFPNVLILTTSNMTAAIDIAFVDRADIKQFIDLPSSLAIYQIYYSCLQELMKNQVIRPNYVILPISMMRITDIEKNCSCKNSKELLKICELSVGLSGRCLRKVPFIAHALFSTTETVPIDIFLDCMRQAVEHLKAEKEHF